MIDLFGNEIKDRKSLREFFLVPPFSILNSSQRDWQEKKKKWMKLISDNAQARQNKSRCPNEPHTKHWQFMAIKGDTTSVLDPVMCEILLHWFTNEGYKTLDPFAGDAVFGFCSAYKNRPFTGIELRKEQADFNQSLIKEHNLDATYICDDSLNIDKYVRDNSVDFIFSCPPYADLEIYSDLKNDLSNMNYDDFFIVIEQILSKTIKKLKENRFAVIVMGEVRHKNTGVFLGIIPKIIDIMVKNGLHYYNEIILQTPIGNLQMRAGISMSSSRKIGKQHQNILVFYKGNPKHIKQNFKSLKP